MNRIRCCGWLTVSLLTCFLLQHTVRAINIVYIKDYPSNSLWRTSLPAKDKPVLLYGHDVRGNTILPSKDGKRVAIGTRFEASAAVYDIWQPGTRKSNVLDPNAESFLGEWTSDQTGVLAGKYLVDGENPEGLHMGVYAALPGNVRRLFASPARKELLPASEARYSPSKNLLAVGSDNWIQVVRVSDGATVYFHSGRQGAGLARLTWIDDDRLIVSEQDSDTGEYVPVLMDIRKRTINSWTECTGADSIVYSRFQSGLYAVIDHSSLWMIDPSKGIRTPVIIDGLDSIFDVLDITPDGRTLLVSSKNDVWAVDLKSHKCMLVAEGASTAVFLPDSEGDSND